MTSGILFLILIFDLFVTVKHLISFNIKLLEIEEAINNYIGQSAEQLKTTAVESFESSKNYIIHIPHLLEIKEKQFIRLVRAFPRMNSLKCTDTFDCVKECLVNNKGYLTVPKGIRCGQTVNDNQHEIKTDR